VRESTAHIIKLETIMNEFDVKAKTWDFDPVKSERAKAVADAIRTECPVTVSASAFEFGCGTGLVSFFMQPYLGRIVMADTSKGMLDVLGEKIRTAGVTNMVPLELDLEVSAPPDEKFDLIYSLLTLHHVAQTQHLLAVFHSMLKAGGFLCIADLDKEDGSFHGEGFTGHNGFDRKDLFAQAEKAGFKNIHFRTVFEFERVVNGTEKKMYPMFLMTAQK
jgi:ubiquinone/menaquinone biosynthesis C-methylase UbiE